jgi:hypothetical protein
MGNMVDPHIVAAERREETCPIWRPETNPSSGPTVSFCGARRSSCRVGPACTGASASAPALCAIGVVSRYRHRSNVNVVWLSMPLASASGAAVGAILALGGVALLVWAITGSDVEVFRFGKLLRPPRTADAGGHYAQVQDVARARLRRASDCRGRRPRFALKRSAPRAAVPEAGPLENQSRRGLIGHQPKTRLRRVLCGRLPRLRDRDGTVHRGRRETLRIDLTSPSLPRSATPR